MKPVLWVASSKDDLRKFSKKVRETFGEALMYAQCGEKHHKTKILKHQGSGGILEVVEDDSKGTFRLVYTIKFAEAVVVLHAFQKKSKSGIATPKSEIQLIQRRLADALHDYKERQAQNEE